jgi:hypothetical protein
VTFFRISLFSWFVLFPHSIIRGPPAASPVLHPHSKIPIAPRRSRAYDWGNIRPQVIRMPRRSSLVLLLLLLFAGQSARAGFAPRDPEKDPLRVHVFSRRVHHNRRFGAFYGEGRANLIEANQIVGVDFSYDCLYKFMDSDADEYYPAKWKNEGLSVEMLMGVIGTDTKTHTCELKIAIKDFVYHRAGGKIVAISPQEYAALDEARAERAQSLTPTDLDPSHYPIEFALLHVAWTGNVSGVHTGTGQANIRTPAGLNAVDFSIHCPVVLQPTPDGRYLLARWLEPGTHMLLLLRSIDVDGAAGATCDLTTVVEPDVYVRNGGNVKAVSQAEYRAKYSGSGSPSTE